MRYRKKPVEVEAIRVADIFATLPSIADLPSWVRDGFFFGSLSIMRDAQHRPPILTTEGVIERPPLFGPCHLVVSTLEGKMQADPDGWLIRGVQGELYPCEPDIFAATYEPVDAVPQAAEADA